jgi:hypothetical protein
MCNVCVHVLSSQRFPIWKKNFVEGIHEDIMLTIAILIVHFLHRKIKKSLYYGNPSDLMNYGVLHNNKLLMRVFV